MKAVIIRIALCLGCLGSLWADFDQGVEAYEAGRYPDAIQAFAAAIEDRETAAARHNLGLAHYQRGNLTEAVWQLERALQLDPHKGPYHYKLGALRQQLGLPTDAPGWADQFGQALSRQGWGLLLLVSGWLSLAVWLLPRCAGWHRSLPLRLLLGLGLSGFALAACGLFQTRDLPRLGIALNPEPSQLHAAPAAAAPASGTIRPGERAVLRESHRAYRKVRTEGGAEGWVHEDDFRRFLPE